MISKNAWTCPKCGAPNLVARKKVITIAMVLALLWIFYQFYSAYQDWKGAERESLLRLRRERSRNLLARPPFAPSDATIS